ncbi:MAG TPA: AMP-binding protein [Kofleriaceae bacterium]
MRIVAVDYRVVRWPIESRGAARGRWNERSAVIVSVRTESGVTGLGEAAPLPGMSIDDVDDAVRACEMLASRLPLTVEVPSHATSIADRVTCAPAARFAIETALLAALAQRMRTSIASLLAPMPQGELRCSVIVDDEAEAIAAVAAGAPCLKLKAPLPADLERVRRIARAVPDVPLRVDANRGWPRDKVGTLLASIAHLPIEFVEEPCLDAHELLNEPLLVRIALDESLIGLSRDQVEHALESPQLAALLLKPTLLGGFARCLELAAAAHSHGVAPIVTHTLEGPIGTAACRELARAISADVPVGLAPHPAEQGFYDSVRPTIIVATHSQDTVDAIHAAFRERRLIALLHAKTTAEEQARQRAMIDAATFKLDDAVVLFTSGSTGPSRGVVLSRQALIANAAASAARLGWQDDDRWLACLPLAHAGGLAIVIRCLLADKPIVLGDVSAIDGDVTLASLVPAQLAQLLEDPAWRPSPKLRAVLLGGAAAPPALIEAAIARGVPVLQTYGLTETFGQVATARAPGERPRPLPGVDISGGTRLAPAPIRIRGPMLATRYLDGTPIAPELGTADLGFVEDGQLYVLGRADDVIISGGENVHPTQVEAVLTATDGVRAAAAFGVSDPRWGQVVAAVIAVTPEFDRGRALDYWHSHLPAHARPRLLGIVRELPRLPSGKLDRRRVANVPTARVDYGRIPATVLDDAPAPPADADRVSASLDDRVPLPPVGGRAPTSPDFNR